MSSIVCSLSHLSSKNKYVGDCLGVSLVEFSDIAIADTNKPSPFDKKLAEALCSLEIPKQPKFSPDGTKKNLYTASF